MTIKNKHCLLFLVTLLVLLLGASMVSASDTDNSSQVIKDVNKLSTPANYDVDKVVQSDEISEANVEKISTTNIITSDSESDQINTISSDNTFVNKTIINIHKNMKKDKILSKIRIHNIL